MNKLRPLREEAVTWLIAAIQERKRWRPARVHEPNGVRVFYGYDDLPTSRNIASGGLVKTQDLQALFPNTPRNPNLLYLISSALPPYAPRMVRWAKKAGAKVVLNQNGVAYPAWHGAGWETANRFLREVLEQADHVLYQSQFCKLGADRYLAPRDAACEVLYNPIDTTLFRPAAVALPRAPVRLLLAGSHQHFYRIQAAVDALKRLRAQNLEVKLEIAGRCSWASGASSAEEQVREYVESQGLSAAVTLSGPYTQVEARSLFHRTHVLIHTQYNDSCPRLVLEAMACGVPVAYSASGGTPELVGPEAGIGVPAPLDWERPHPPDPEQLAEAIRKILAAHGQYSSAARRRAVARFDVKPWLERHRELFWGLVEGGALER